MREHVSALKEFLFATANTLLALVNFCSEAPSSSAQLTKPARSPLRQTQEMDNTDVPRERQIIGRQEHAGALGKDATAGLVDAYPSVLHAVHAVHAAGQTMNDLG